MIRGISSTEELDKIIMVKKMDLEECELELNSRYYPSVVRTAMMHYISELQNQLVIFNAERFKKMENR